MAGVLNRFSFATETTTQQLKNSSNNENTVKSTAFWLSVWKKWCIEKGIAKKIKITSRPSLTLCSSDSTPKLKTNMVKPRKRRFHFIESVSDTDWTIPWTVSPDFELFCVLEMWKYCILLFWLYAVVLTERALSLAGLNKLFLHLMRALLLNRPFSSCVLSC